MFYYSQVLKLIEPKAIICYCEPFEEMEGNIIKIDYAETNRLSQKKSFYGYVYNDWCESESEQLHEVLAKTSSSYVTKTSGYVVTAGMGSGGVRYTDTWTSLGSLKHHFNKHGKQFNSLNPQDYARKAQELYRGRTHYQSKTDSDDVTRVYDAETNSFGSYNSQGKTITFFKPSQGQRYFDRQPGE